MFNKKLFIDHTKNTTNHNKMTQAGVKAPFSINEQAGAGAVAAQKSREYVSKHIKGTRTPPHQDFIQGTYKSLEKDGLVPYQGPGGEVQLTDKYGPEPYFDYEGAREASYQPGEAISGLKDIIGKNVDFFKLALTGRGDGSEDPEARQKYFSELDRLGADRLNRYSGMVDRGDMTMDEFDDHYRTMRRGIAGRKGPTAVAELEKEFERDDFWKEHGPDMAKRIAGYKYEREAEKTKQLIAGRGTVAGKKAIDDVLSKPAHSAKAEEARQQVIASRARMADQDREAGHTTALSDPDAFTMYSKLVTPSGKTDSGEAAFTSDDRLGYHAARARQERDATAKRMLDMQMMREFGTTDPAKMRYEQYSGFAGGVDDDGGSSYGEISSKYGWDRFDLNKRIINARREERERRKMQADYADAQETGRGPGLFLKKDQSGNIVRMNDDETRAVNDRIMADIEARYNTPEAIADRKRQQETLNRHRENRDRVNAEIDEYSSSEAGSSAIQKRIDRINAYRKSKGRGMMDPAMEDRLRRKEAVKGVLANRRNERIRNSSSGNESTSSEEPYPRTVDSNSIPGNENAPPGATTTFTGPGGAGFSTMPPPIFSTKGIIDRLSRGRNS